MMVFVWQINVWIVFWQFRFKTNLFHNSGQSGFYGCLLNIKFYDVVMCRHVAIFRRTTKSDQKPNSNRWNNSLPANGYLGGHLWVAWNGFLICRLVESFTMMCGYLPCWCSACRTIDKANLQFSKGPLVAPSIPTIWIKARFDKSLLEPQKSVHILNKYSSSFSTKPAHGVVSELLTPQLTLR